MSQENKATYDLRLYTVENLPTLALRGISVFPDMLLNFDVERPMSVAALEASLSGEQKIFLLTQKDIMQEQPGEGDMYRVGTVCAVRQLLRLPGNSVRVMVEGLYRAKLVGLTRLEPYFSAEVEGVPSIQADVTKRTEALMRQCFELFATYCELSSGLSAENVAQVTTSRDPGYIADYIAQNIYLNYVDKQKILEEFHPVRRLQKVSKLLKRENDILEIERQLSDKTQEQLVKAQRDNILREQLRVIQNELGEGDDFFGELDEYHDKIVKLGLAKEVEEKLLKEVSRLAKQPYGSSEGAVIRSYLDTCLELPWNIETRDRLDIQAAQRILDADHYGLEKVKRRIIEYLSVRKLAPKANGMILCLVGPPGTGKTSVAASIARAMNRKMARISLGGIHDEAEIRGHRKTYVGAMPGRIIAAIRQAGSKNPLLLLDEIDKLGSDYRGDPSAALLEALDSEQNSTFRDHFLEVPFDLSDVLFVVTANTTDTIPRPILDRMEVIEISSYTDEEKLHIAKEHLVPKQRKKHGLTGRQLRFTDDAIRGIITGYTRESGVRQLAQELAAVCRKAAASVVSGSPSVSVTPHNLEELLGPKKFKPDQLGKKDQVGVVNGLAWTSVGGELLQVEVNVLPGNGKLELTGNLGDVMKESAKAAVSYIRSRTESLGIDPDFYKNKDIHIHFPEGAIPKDGPSAGITIAVAVVSALTGIPVRSSVAMTGEISLRGRVLPIGGLREKTMAALRNGIQTVILPKDNEPDLEEIDQNVRKALHFEPVEHMDGVLPLALDMQHQAPEQGGHLPAAGEKKPTGVALRQ